MENKFEKDFFEEVTFHPSLDIKVGIIILGFRIKPDRENEKDIFVVGTKNRLLLTEEKKIQIDGKEYFIDRRERLLTKLSDRWSLDALKSFCNGYNKAENGIIPNPHKVFISISSLLQKYVGLEKSEDYLITTAWIISTYFYMIFSAYPFLNIKAPKGSGKSQFLNFLLQTCFNPIKTRASLPALRDTMDALRGTFLMDQADSLHGINNGELLDILTDSYRRGGGENRKMVQDKNKKWTPIEFEIFGPKAFASINQLPTDLRDRCLEIQIVRSRKNYPSPDDEMNDWKAVRGELYKLLLSHFSVMSLHYEIKKTIYRNNQEITGRRLELWLPIEIILTVCNIPNEELEKVQKRFFDSYQHSEYQTTDFDNVVIDEIRNKLGDNNEIVLSPKEIAENMDQELFKPNSNTKYRATQVGRVIQMFHLDSEKLPRSNKGERYRFSKDHVQEIERAYFSIKNEKVDTPSYTSENGVENTTLF